jgi:hypothetical protein
VTTEDSTTELIYGEGGEGLEFLEKQYALHIGHFREALYKSRTWGELNSRVGEKDYKDIVEMWVESELERLEYEDDEEPEVAPPSPDDAFDADSLPGYADGDWPVFAPRVMGTWVDEEVIEEYGEYVYPTLNAEYPVIDPASEEKVVSLLEERGYVCIRDDDLVWEAVWGS